MDNSKIPMTDKTDSRTEIADNQTTYTTIEVPKTYLDAHPTISKQGTIFLNIMTILNVLFVVLPVVYLIFLLLVNAGGWSGIGLLFIAPFMYAVAVTTLVTMPIFLVRYHEDPRVRTQAGGMLLFPVLILAVNAIRNL